MSGPIRGFAIALPGLNFYGSSFRFRLVLPLVSDDLQLSLELLAAKDDGAAEIKQEDYKRSESSLFIFHPLKIGMQRLCTELINPTRLSNLSLVP